MSDILKGIPVRTEQDTHERVQVKVIDFTDPTRGQTVDADGAAKVLVTGKDSAGVNRTALMSTTGQTHVIIDDKDADETPVTDSNTSTAVAVGLNSTHTYLVPAGKTLLLKKIAAAASGRGRFEVKTGVVGSEVTKMVRFGSVANPNTDFDFSSEPIRVTAGQNVLVVKTNTDLAAQDMYSHIIGTLI